MGKGKNILLSLMQLNIGGAETHVVELAKELKRKGFNVVVTSNGGVYVKELEEAGIKHYAVPLQNKNPLNVFKAQKLLAKIIKDEKIDIVHSHARIPSFILGRLHKKMKFPFVTTAHWVFSTKWGLKYITNWGEKTVAVSEDIKTYLMDNYKIPAADIQVTINGIDTERFSPDTDFSDIKKEFNISDDEYVISYVSRLDESRSLVAKQLIEVVPEIDKLIGKLRVIIVGGGDDFENVKAKAQAVNKALGREVITLTGPRTDINKLVAPCRLFVGVSRAALEAMAAEKPVVISGNEGYIGLFDESKLKVGIDTNFCCRGCAEPTGELLLADIKKFISMSEEEKKRLGEYGRELIKKEYSVSRMTEDSIKVYDWALQKNKEILVSGYYGFNNSGDDALLLAIIQDIKKFKESPNLVVLSKNPKETAKAYRVKAINRFNLFKIAKHMKNAEMLISGGGTLIQDGTSAKSLWYYLEIIKLAIRNGLKVMLYSNGIGPLNHVSSIKKTRKVLNKVDLITLRDENSKKVLEAAGVTKPKTLVTADPAFNLEGMDIEKGREILKNAGVPMDKKLLGISVRKWSENSRNFESIIAQVCDWASEKYGLHPVFLPMQAEKDMTISKNIISKMKNKASIVENRHAVEGTMSTVGCMDMCIGMRLHSLIYAAIGFVPLVGLVYDPKITSFLDYTHQKLCLDVKNMTSDELKKAIDCCMENHDKIVEDLKNNYGQLKEKSLKTAELAIELYEKGSVSI